MKTFGILFLCVLLIVISGCISMKEEGVPEIVSKDSIILPNERFVVYSTSASGLYGGEKTTLYSDGIVENFRNTLPGSEVTKILKKFSEDDVKELIQVIYFTGVLTKKCETTTFNFDDYHFSTAGVPGQNVNVQHISTCDPEFSTIRSKYQEIYERTLDYESDEVETMANDTSNGLNYLCEPYDYGNSDIDFVSSLIIDGEFCVFTRIEFEDSNSTFVEFCENEACENPAAIEPLFIVGEINPTSCDVVLPKHDIYLVDKKNVVYGCDVNG